MAAQDYTGVVQQLYISYFGRPADYYGLQNFTTALNALDTKGEYKTFASVSNALQADKAGTSALSKLVNSFNNSAESNALYGTDNSQIGISKFVAAIYQNVLGREADPSGLTFWVNAITSGGLTKANAAASITAAAMVNTSAQGLLDAKTVTNKLAVATSFTTNLDTTSEINAYSGDVAAASARSLLANVNNTTDTAAYQATVNASIEQIVAVANAGSTYTLTSGVDTLVGTTLNDTFVVTNSAANGNPMNAFDAIDGGAGNDTLNITDTVSAAGTQFSVTAATTAGATVKNVENVNLTTTGGAVLDTTSWAGVNKVTVSSAGTAAAAVTAGSSTAVNLNSATTAGATVTGGSAVNATLTAGTNAGAVNVTGAGLTTVSIKGGNVVTVDNQDAKAATAKGATLTAVTLDGIAGGATLKGASLTSVSLNNLSTAQTVTVTNGTASHTLNVAANTAGATGTAAAVVTVADATATTIALTASGKSNLAVSAAAATKITVNAADALTLDLAAAQTKLATIDASASAGAVTLTNLGTAVTSVTTGAGADKVTVNTATSSAADATVNVAVATGAGDDDITIAVTGTGSYTVNAGDGNDTIRVNQAQLVAGSTINGGAGTDTLILGNNTAAFAAGDYAVVNSLVSNIETVEFKNAVGGIDASKVAFTTMMFDNTGIVTGVSTQTLSTSGTALTATANGHVVGDTYAGNLNVITTGAASALTLNADTATVNVKASTANAAAATIGGDLKTSLTVNLTNAANASSSPTNDNLSSATVLVNGTANTALKSVVLTGAGSVTIDASASTALTSVDASALGGTIANGGTGVKGSITGGLTFMGNAAIAETITLGSGHDVITVASTYGKMDSIVGFDATKEGSTGASTTDVLIIKAAQLGGGATADLTLNGNALTGGATSTAGISKLTLSSADSTLDLAFVHAASAANTANGVVQFQFGGNTYLFADTNHNGVLDTSDFAVKLVGSVDVTAGFGVAAA